MHFKAKVDLKQNLNNKTSSFIDARLFLLSSKCFILKHLVKFADAVL